ncbi:MULTISPECIES: hypothetical protein [Falsihalocynthiibacter]|uniref:hypothetical protein n=1 Tax=Falsihalocynthiibacter TaxID=2854182 RepID=UPI00300265D3
MTEIQIDHLLIGHKICEGHRLRDWIMVTSDNKCQLQSRFLCKLILPVNPVASKAGVRVTRSIFICEAWVG